MILATNQPSDQVPASGETGVSDANEGGWFTLSPHGEPDVDQPDPNRIPAIVTFRNDTPDLADDAWTYVGPMVADRGLCRRPHLRVPGRIPAGRCGRGHRRDHAHPLQGRLLPADPLVYGAAGRAGAAGRRSFPAGAISATASTRCSPSATTTAAVSPSVALPTTAGCVARRPAAPTARCRCRAKLHVRDGRLFSRPVDEVYDLLIGGELRWTRRAMVGGCRATPIMRISVDRRLHGGARRYRRGAVDPGMP